MVPRSPARLLAPLALGASLLAVIVVVATSTGGSPDVVPRTERAPAATTAQPREQGPAAKPRTYVVQAGDNLSLIAEETGVTLEELEELNPDVDAQTLRVGQRLRLSAPPAP